MLGAGGHASVLMDILEQNKIKVDRIYAPEINGERSVFKGVPFYKDEDEIFQQDSNTIKLVNGVGFLPHSRGRQRISEKFISRGFRFLSIISQSAEISSNAKLGSGVQVLNGAIVQTGAVISDETILNTRAIIEHDCSIGPMNHIAPNATLCGGVNTGANVFVGAGAVVLPNSQIKDCAVLQAFSLHKS